MKRWIVFIVSCCVFVLDRIRTLCLVVMGRRPRGTCVVLMYHGVSSDQRSRFARQMDLALAMARPLAADSRAPLETGRKHFAVTFDDGLSNVVENALPELEARGIPATMFVATGGLGEPPTWTSYETGKSWARSGRSGDTMLTREQVRELSGRVLIGSHTVEHPRLSDIDAERARFELETSRQELREITRDDVTLLSFPYGAFSNEVLTICKEAGYERVFSNLPVCAFAEPGEFLSGRVAADPTDSMFEFRMKVSGAYRWLPTAFAVKRWIKLRENSTSANDVCQIDQP